jgi:hypothetical protein
LSIYRGTSLLLVSPAAVLQSSHWIPRGDTVSIGQRMTEHATPDFLWSLHVRSKCNLPPSPYFLGWPSLWFSLLPGQLKLDGGQAYDCSSD